MKPVQFKEANSVFAENQDEYLDLPAYHDETEVISCWTFSFWERIKILLGYPLWVRVLNHGEPLQPILPGLERPFENG